MSDVDPPSAKGFIHAWATLLERLAGATVRRPWAFVAVALLSFLPAAWLASKLELKSSFIDLLSVDDPEVQDLNLVLKKTGGLGFSTIAIAAKDRPKAEALAVEMASRLEKLPGVKFVQARLDVEFIEDRQLYYLSAKELDELTTEVKAAIDHRVKKEAGLLLDEDEAPPVDPLDRIKKEGEKKGLGLSPFLIGNDGAYLYVLLGLGGSVGDLDATVRSQAEVERVARETAAEVAPGVEVLFTGPIVNRRDDAAFLGQDLSRAGIIGFVGVVGIVLVATRKRRPVLLLSLPLALGLSWTFAFAYLTVHHLNAVSGFLVSILSGLGIEYGIHLYKRYVEERRRGRDPHESTLRMLRSTGGALLAACLVNASVFAVVAVAGFRGFMEFGLIASVG
ncbi:MAG: MMPL family transporter, partial [Polyangiaceae bacterium]|nr:MMPL family transporter [Polyangiaceae bacterium]